MPETFVFSPEITEDEVSRKAFECHFEIKVSC